MHVDDIIIAALTNKRLAQVKRDLASRFDIKDLGKLHHFLGMKIVQDEANGSVWISQPAYIETLLKRFGMEHAKASATIIDPGNKLVKALEEDELFDQHTYQSAAYCTCLSLLDLTSRFQPAMWPSSLLNQLCDTGLPSSRSCDT